MQHHLPGVVQLSLFKELQFPAEQDIFALKGHVVCKCILLLLKLVQSCPLCIIR